jgi:hypothetical protein
LGFHVFTIKFPSASRGLTIAPVTGSRGNGFGPLFAPVVGAFGAFSLFDEFVVIIEIMGATFQHILKTFQHIPKTLQHISLFNTFFNQNAKKKLYNTFLNYYFDLCVKK